VGTPSPVGSYDDFTYWNISSSDVGGVETVDFTILANFSGVKDRGNPDNPDVGLFLILMKKFFLPKKSPA